MIKLLLCVTTLLTSCAAVTPARKDESRTILFVGKVERLAPQMDVSSGQLAVYRLAKYHIEHLCEGKYEGTEIVVDHLIITGEELKDIKVGDLVCVAAEKSDKIFARFNAEGIRDPSEAVKTFFVGGKAKLFDEVTGCTHCSIDTK
jgi:hypothetical protein